MKFIKIFWITIIFYSILWVLSPNNKIILGLCLGLLIVLNYVIKNWRYALITTILILQSITTGKTYEIILVPPGTFPIDFWPNGFSINFVLSPGFLLSLGLLPLLLLKSSRIALKKISITLPDIFLTLYTSWIIFSNLFGSGWPSVSTILTIYPIIQYIFYISIRISTKNDFMQKAFLYILLSLTILESVFALHQFSVGGPTGKSIEAQQNIDLFGEASDELSFRFRPTGTFDHANALGGFLAYSTTYILPVALTKPSVIAFISLILGAIAIVVTLSRSAWLAMTISFFIVFILVKNRIRVHLSKFQIFSLTTCFVGLFILFILPRLIASLNVASQTGGAHTRKLQTTATLSLVTRHPLFGVGSGMSVPATLLIDSTGIFHQFPATIHNAYLAMAAENGIPTLLFFICFMVSYLRQFIAKKIYHELPVIGAIAGTVALCIVMIFQPYTFGGLIITGLAIANSYDKNHI